MARADADAPGAAAHPGAGARALAEAIAEPHRAPFELGTWPLLRPLLVRGDGGARWFVLVVPHAIWDAASSAQLERELERLLDGATPTPLAIQIGDLADWEREAVAPRRPNAGGKPASSGRARH